MPFLYHGQEFPVSIFNYTMYRWIVTGDSYDSLFIDAPSVLRLGFLVNNLVGLNELTEYRGSVSGLRF